MYRLNPLPRKVLITTDEVINQGPTDATVDPRTILSAIQIAEDRFIKKAVCNSLYYDFREQKNVVVTEINKSFLEDTINDSIQETNGQIEPVVLQVGEIVNAIEFVQNEWYVKLWNEYLWKLVAECVIYVATPTNYSRYTSQGEMMNNPKIISMQNDGSGSQSVELKDLKWKMDKMLMDRVDPIISSMEEWICENISNFPKYDCKKCTTDSNGISMKRKSAWIHAYNDKSENEKCCD